MLINKINKKLQNIVFAILLAFIAAPSMAQQPIVAPATKVMASEPFIHDQLGIQKQDGEELLFNVELALTPAQQAKGMMYRTYMESDSGMLFVFKDVAKRSFWMKNTLIPLDMIFIARDGEIHHIHHNAKPQDLTKITSEAESYAVLEIKGGMADKFGIKEGDKILHSFFRNIVSK